eukprot:scaffold22560_cov135-Cylindrotheca_fusiformis.AAC.79
MDQEAKFLKSQQARVNTIERSQRVQRVDSIHSFWATLREKRSAWESKLCALGESQGQQAALYQELQDLKAELHQIRKHCLGSTVCYDDWEVPDLPVADLRLLHDEFSRCFSVWEATKKQISPKGNFSFRRYREEIARRKAQGIPLSAPVAAESALSSKPHLLKEGACLQGLSNVSIVIDSKGNVRVRDEHIMKIGLFLLNFFTHHVLNSNRSKKLVTLHIVDTSDTEIILDDPARAIHVTNCHTSSLNAFAQQLRLHKSTDLTCTVEVSAGAIMEDCTRLVFCSEMIEVKDFNWLRSGVASPNFEIKAPLKSEDSLVQVVSNAEESPVNGFGENEVSFQESQMPSRLTQNSESDPPNDEKGRLTIDDDEDDEL